MLPLEPLLEPELGEVGDGVLLGEAGEVLLLVPPAAPLLDLLKWASHSAREMVPSLFVSTDEKVGVELLALLLPDAAPPLDDAPDEPDMPEEPLELPDAAGEEDLSLLVLLEELCATAALDSASRAAAVAAVRSFSFNIGKILLRMSEMSCTRSGCKTRTFHPT